MEFGVFFNGYLPGPAAHDPDSEHLMLMREIEYAILADQCNWKYAWFGEHHGLPEYSHMSAPAPIMGYVAACTARIHLGFAVNSFPTTKEHPVRIAETAAMLDHITDGRFEFGTGRGAVRHEIATFNGLSATETRSMWDEVIHEIPRMWEEKDYDFVGKHFSVPAPRNILPKPLGQGHPPLWVAGGHADTFVKAGQHGIGAIAFNFESIYHYKDRIASYKEAIDNPIDQIGQYRNNNVMMTHACICLEDRDQARAIAKMRTGYRVTMINLYHDIMPESPYARVWPNSQAAFEWTDELLDRAIETGYLLCGNPEEVCEQLERYQSVGCDQLAFGIPDEGYAHDEVLEMIEVFGNQVIPEFDTDQAHSTTRFRQQAKRRFPDFKYPISAEVNKADPPLYAVSV